MVNEVLDQGYGVVFVDDGSSNGLFDRLQEVFRERKEVVLIRHIFSVISQIFWRSLRKMRV